MLASNEIKRISSTLGKPPGELANHLRASRAPFWRIGARSFEHHSVQGSLPSYHPEGSPLFHPGSCNRIRAPLGDLASGLSAVYTSARGGLARFQATGDRPTDGDRLFPTTRRLQLLRSPFSHPRTSILMKKKMKDLHYPRREGGKSQSTVRL
jgi:hypothetical protein